MSDSSERMDAPRQQLLTALLEDVLRRRLAGEALSDAAVLGAHPELAPDLRPRLADLRPVVDALWRARKGSSFGLSETAAPFLTHHGEVQVDFSLPGYTDLTMIAAGGQGVVYRGLQTSTGRVVAIKLLHAGPQGGAYDQARIEREARILGQLRHPNIVMIHDSGTVQGRVYLIMEYIDGRPLDQWAETIAAPGLPLMVAGVRRILSVFARICDAVHEAHLRGIIHRDLKPSNIRVDANDEPHVLDFGLARAGDAGSIEAELTQTGGFVGSLPWASPEQVQRTATGLDLRSDVYSLGVMLYQSLTGRFPYPRGGSIRDTIDGIVSLTPVGPRRFSNAIDADVEIVVLTCLQKDPARRYQSAGALARDLRGVLDGRPIEARGDSGWYLLRKGLQRHWLAVSIAAAFVMLLASGTIGMSVLYEQAHEQAVIAGHERDSARESQALAQERQKRAEQATEHAQQIKDFLILTLTSADPFGPSKRDTTVLEALQRATANLSKQLAGQPAVEAEVRFTIGQIYSDLTHYADAEPQLQQALELYRQTLGDDSIDTLVCKSELALLLKRLNRLNEAEPMMVDLVERGRHSIGPDDPDVLLWANNLGRLLVARGRLAEAEEMLRDTLERRRRVLGNQQLATLTSINNLALLLAQQGRLNEAEPLAREAADGGRATLGLDNPDALVWQNNLANLLDGRGRLDESEELYREVLERRTKLLGQEHEQTLTSMNNLGYMLNKRDRPKEADQLLRQALEIQRRVLGNDHPNTLLTMHNLSRSLGKQGRPADAQALARETIAMRRESQGAEHPDVFLSSALLARLLIEDAKIDEAEALLRDLITAAERALNPRHYLLPVMRSALGECLLRRGEFAQSEALLLPAYEELRGRLGPGNDGTRQTRATLVELYEKTGRSEDAARLQAEPSASAEKASTQPQNP